MNNYSSEYKFTNNKSRNLMSNITSVVAKGNSSFLAFGLQATEVNCSYTWYAEDGFSPNM